ncbi:hypothetical protein [Nocardioides mesophilus]|uniref:Uncharacterized protein n=1 Tax=Nocardioides mesophilus TaxID=433659 RepID=A0A7G9RBP0_9ACTN|nr:hypothetical protein [Nocardioides mesophilus]QNN53015.1 hypothetical protein H9L09_00420 [Nocardioides mesophilus]
MAVPELTCAVLRRTVGELRRRETRRVFDPSICLGTLGGPHESFVLRAQDLPVLDAALRMEIVSRLVSLATEPPRVGWLVRPGAPEDYESDREWCAATTSALSMHGIELEAFYAVTRYGWRDVRSGESRTWRRLRI